MSGSQGPSGHRQPGGAGLRGGCSGAGRGLPRTGIRAGRVSASWERTGPGALSSEGLGGEDSSQHGGHGWARDQQAGRLGRHRRPHGTVQGRPEARPARRTFARRHTRDAWESLSLGTGRGVSRAARAVCLGLTRAGGARKLKEADRVKGTMTPASMERARGLLTPTSVGFCLWDPGKTLPRAGEAQDTPTLCLGLPGEQGPLLIPKSCVTLCHGLPGPQVTLVPRSYADGPGPFRRRPLDRGPPGHPDPVSPAVRSPQP